MPYTDLLLYFFSGTGNTYRTAMWMAETAQQQGLPARVVPLDAAQPADLTGPGQLIGLLSPTHAFCAPWAMIAFALRLPPGNGRSAFTLLTRAGMIFGSTLIPGLEGSGAYLLALILALKGYRVVGVRGLDLPVSWTPLIPGYSQDKAEAILARARPVADAFLQAILSGKRRFLSLLPLFFGLLLLPVTFLYLVMGRFFLAKLFYANDRCNGCGLCAQSCPVQGIRMRGKEPPRPYWTFFCESCTRCYNFCPQKAVETSYPLGAILFYLANIPLAALLLDWLARWLVQTAGWKGTLVETVLQYPFKLLSIAVGYFLFSLAMRIPWVNRGITLLTPSHYYHRYQSPGTKLKQMIR